MAGLDVVHLLRVAIRPALEAMGPKCSSVAAEQLVLGTAAKESGLVWLLQLGHGPAVGLWQMEPATFRDMRDRFLSGDEPWKTQMRRALAPMSARMRPDATELAWNLQLGAAYCRLKYLSKDEPLPAQDDVQGMASYWKRHYNTHLGAGRPEEFERTWYEYIRPRVKELWPK